MVSSSPQTEATSHIKDDISRLIFCGIFLMMWVGVVDDIGSFCFCARGFSAPAIRIAAFGLRRSPWNGRQATCDMNSVSGVVIRD